MAKSQRKTYTLEELAKNIKDALREQYEWLKRGEYAMTWHTLIPSILVKITKGFEDWYKALVNIYSEVGAKDKVSKHMMAVTSGHFVDGMCSCRYSKVVDPIPNKILVSERIEPVPPLCPLAVLAFGSIGKGFSGIVYVSPEPISNENCTTLYPKEEKQAEVYIVVCKDREENTKAVPVLWSIKRKGSRHGAREHFIY